MWAGEYSYEGEGEATMTEENYALEARGIVKIFSNHVALDKVDFGLLLEQGFASLTVALHVVARNGDEL